MPSMVRVGEDPRGGAGGHRSPPPPPRKKVQARGSGTASRSVGHWGQGPPQDDPVNGGVRVSTIPLRCDGAWAVRTGPGRGAVATNEGRAVISVKEEEGPDAEMAQTCGGPDSDSDSGGGGGLRMQ